MAQNPVFRGGGQIPDTPSTVQETVNFGLPQAIAGPGNVLDALLKLRMSEQEQARELFTLLAKTNPALVQHILTTQPGLLGELTKMPRAIPRKAERGQPPLGQRVIQAAQAAPVGGALESTDVRGATEIVQRTLRNLQQRGEDIKPFTDAAATITTNLASGVPDMFAGTKLTDDQRARFLSAPDAQALGTETAAMAAWQRANPNATPEQVQAQAVAIRTALSQAEPKEIREYQLTILKDRAQLIAAQTQLAQAALDRQRQGAPLSADAFAEATARVHSSQLVVNAYDAALASYDKAATGDAKAQKAVQDALSSLIILEREQAIPLINEAHRGFSPELKILLTTLRDLQNNLLQVNRQLLSTGKAPGSQTLLTPPAGGQPPADVEVETNRILQQLLAEPE